jgi:MFS family permease
MSTVTRKHLYSALLGNLFEHYDTALFGFLSPFLAPLIFPHHDPITALILTYAIIPIGMLARPVGSLVFGYIGDVYGRGYALFLTLAGMSLLSLCIAMTPTYAQIGIAAPLLFCLGRVFQNFLAAGETMGGAIYLLENSRKERHDWLSGIYNATTMCGHLLASWGVFMISTYCEVTSYWRVLYLAGCITGLFGLTWRKSLQFDQQPKEKPQTLKQLKVLFWDYKKPLIAIAILSGFARSCYSVALVLMNGFIPLISSLSKSEVMKINTYLLILDVCALPFFGWIASRVPRKHLMLSASLGAFFFGMPLMVSLENATLVEMILVRMCFVLFGVSFFAPFHAFAQELIPKSHRYAVISFGYAIGSQLIGGPTAAISLWCFQKTHLASSAAIYWVILAGASSLIIFSLMKQQESKDLEVVL